MDLAGTLTYDPARRSEKVLYNSSYGAVFDESLIWTAGGLMKQSIRGDLGGRGFDFDYDSSYRLTGASRVAVDDSGISQMGGCSVLPNTYSFSYDQMDNLLSKTSTQICEDSTVDLPLDGTGRNRPGSVSGEALVWGANGNLEQNGDFELVYDYRDRLTEVRTALGNTSVTSYTYDALNRRIEKDVGGVITRTIWSGQQPIENYVGGLLRSRRTYGVGMDEIVSMEIDLSGDGNLDNEYVPFYDNTGNLVSLTDIFGRVIERYEYSPFGERWILVDSTIPAVEQVRVKGDALQVEFSEELLESALKQAVADGALKLENLTKDQLVDIEVARPILTGRQARRRLVISGVDPPEAESSTWPEAGDLVQLQIPVSALEDSFDNVASEGYTKSFTWPAVGEIVEDLAAPRLDRICVITDGRVEIELTEEISTVSANAEIEIDGVSVIWTVDPDGYVLRSQDPLGPGSYQLSIGTGSLDLSGKGLSGGHSETFTVTLGKEAVVYSAPFPGLVEVSTASNDFGYHGLRHDSETGFVYVRQRYYDPQLGRFISTDPYGYADSPNLYQFSLNNPANFGDPTGQWVESAFDFLSLGIGVASYNHNLAEGNFNAATLDAIGIVVDVFAILAPVPGGAGAALKAVRAAKEMKRLDRAKDTVKAFSAGYGLARSPANPTAAAKISRLVQVVDQSVNIGQGAVMGTQEYLLGNDGLAAFNAGMAGVGAVGVWAKLNPCKLRCFAAGTLVLTEDGERPIEEIEVGDRVWAWNEETGENELAEVVRLFERETLELYTLYLGDKTIDTTAEHPFWVLDWGWTRSDELMAGDRLLSYDGSELIIDDVTRTDRNAKVFNFEVQGIHTYFVSEMRLVTHNCGNRWIKFLRENKGRYKIWQQPVAYRFRNIEGKSVEEIEKLIPKNATKRILRPIPGAVEKGVEYSFKYKHGPTIRVRMHGVDGTAPAGSNAARGWIVRVLAGKSPMDNNGVFHRPGIHNKNSPFYDEDAINATHIPIVEKK